MPSFSLHKRRVKKALFERKTLCCIVLQSEEILFQKGPWTEVGFVKPYQCSSREMYIYIFFLKKSIKEECLELGVSSLCMNGRKSESTEVKRSSHKSVILRSIPTILIVKFCNKANVKRTLSVVVSNTLDIPIKSTSYIPALNRYISNHDTRRQVAHNFSVLPMKQ